MHRGITAAGIVSTSIVAACSLGVVDLRLAPSSAEFFVAAEFEADPDDPARTQVVVKAVVEPGITIDGRQRRLVTELLGVEDENHVPLASSEPENPSWMVTESYETPGPFAVPIRLPALEGLGFPRTINMRVRVEATPPGTIVLAPDEDLVLTTEPPSNPAESLQWRFRILSSSLPGFQVNTTGSGPWPTEVRINAAQMPAEAFPLDAELIISWDRSLTLFELTPAEQYNVALRSTMLLEWTVEAGG